MSERVGTSLVIAAIVAAVVLLAWTIVADHNMKSQTEYVTVCAVAAEEFQQKILECVEATSQSNLRSLSSDDMDFEDTVYACRSVTTSALCETDRYTRESLSRAGYNRLDKTVANPLLLEKW